MTSSYCFWRPFSRVSMSLVVCLGVCAAGQQTLTSPRSNRNTAPPFTGACPHANDRAGRRAVVLSWAQQLLNGSFQAGGSYANAVFVRDTATFVDVALDSAPAKTIRPLLLQILSYQHENGDLGCEGVAVNPKTGVAESPMLKSDAATDQETSFVQMIYKYVKHTTDTSILGSSISSKNDAVNRTVLERMDRMLEYLANTSGRTSANTGLLWGATMVDWGDVQQCQGPAGCNQQIDDRTTVALNVYVNAMYAVAMQNLAELSAPQLASKWRARAAVLKARSMDVLWDSHRSKFRAHVYLNETVCGPSRGSKSFQCFPPKGSPFKDIQGFQEDDVYYHGATFIAMQAGWLTQDQVSRALADMRHNVEQANSGPGGKLNGNITIGLTVYPPYPPGAFPVMRPFEYQNGGDWSWFGGRLVQQLVRFGMLDDAETELTPMIDRVCANGDFREWYDIGNVPSGSTGFHGSAGELGSAIKLLESALKARTFVV